jgi:glycosyltransferase involved in cell wall biosynthesis
MTAGKTVHFVYATPYSFIDKITMRLFRKKLCHPAWDEYDWQSPIKAPLSITYNIAKALSGKYRLKLYHLKERITIEPEEGDILLGHVWTDPDSIVRKALDDKKFSKKFLIGPYNHDPRQVGWMREFIEKCDGFFAICGDYWMDSFDRSPFSDLKEKVIHLNMAIDTADYPIVKNKFSAPGDRSFFYIGRYGSFGDEKGVHLLESLAAGIPGFRGGYICPDGEIKGWQCISPPRILTRDFMEKVAADYDVFVNMSRADAQATTVLEAMSWGFPVACTRETGYTSDTLFNLGLEDEVNNLATINKIQEISCSDLEAMVAANRTTLATKYSWDRFVERLVSSLEK